MPINLLDKVRAALKRPTPTKEQLAAAVDDARRAQAEAVAAVERAQATVAAGFMDGETKRAADRAALTAAREAAEDTALVLAEAERRHDAAVNAEAEAVRAATYAAAKAKADAVSANLVDRYTAAAGGLVALLRDIADANAAVDAANADRPAGSAQLPGPEVMARSTPGLPWMPDEVETVERWAFLDGTPVAEEYLPNVVSYGSGRGSYKTHRKEGLDDVDVGQPVEMRRFQRVTSYQPTAGTYPVDIVRSIRLPHLYADHNIIGSDAILNTWASDADLVRDAEEALSTMTKLEVATAATRPKRVELRPVWSPAEVAKANAPASDYHDRVVPKDTGSRFGGSPFAKPGARAGARR